MEKKKMKCLMLIKEYLQNINVKPLTIRAKEWDLLLNRKLTADSKYTSNKSQEEDNGNIPFKRNYISHNQKYLDLIKFFESMKLKLPMSTVQEVKKVPEWKTRRPAYLRDELSFKTNKIFWDVVSPEESLMKSLETLLDHIQRHPEAIVHAVKKNLIPVLLKLERKTNNDEACLQTIRQILTILGNAGPPSSRGIRILSIDGGGMRGIAVIKMLEKIESSCGKKIHELFDLVCGVSTGAIITCCLVPPHCMSLDEIYQLYRNMSIKVFKQSTFWGTSKLIWSHGYYDTSVWEDLLRCYVGKANLLDSAKHANCPKMAIVSTIVNHSRAAPYVFRNYAFPYNRCSEYLGSFKHTMFEAVRASAAAPTIFDEFRTGNILHQDGGLIVNNPTAVALHEARTLWPRESIACIVSCGTGRYEPLPSGEELNNQKEGSSSWKTILDKILESATDTEAIHTIMSDILPDDVYFRLNPHLSSMVAMDDTDDHRLATLEEDTNMYCRRNEERFIEIAKTLVAKRSLLQRSYDFLSLQSKLLSVS